MRFDKFLKAAEQRHPTLVLQVSWANGLDIIRDLAAADVPLLAVDANPRALGLHSRLAAGMVCPDPREDEEAFVVFLEQLGARLPRRAVLFPTHDQYIWPISRHAKRLEPWYIIPFSRWETMRRLHDKREQLETARRVGVDIPKTVFVDDDDDLARGADEIGFPAIFKPVESLAFKVRFRRHVLEIASRDELLRVYDKVRDCGTLMLQDIVPGGDEELYTLGSYLDAQSRPLAQFTGHKLRQHPPRFGHVSMAVSLWVPALAVRRRHGLPRPAGRRGGLPHLARGARRAAAAARRRLSQPRRVHLAALAPRRAARALVHRPLLPLGRDAARARQARPDGGRLARLSCTRCIASQREKGTMNQGSSRSAWRESGQMYSSWLGQTTAGRGSRAPSSSSQVRKASSSASGSGQTMPAA